VLKTYYLLLYFCLCGVSLQAQDVVVPTPKVVSDSMIKKGIVVVPKDSLKKAISDSIAHKINIVQKKDTLQKPTTDSTQLKKSSTVSRSDSVHKAATPPIQPKAITYSFALNGDFKSGNVRRELLGASFAFNFEHPRSDFGFFTNPRYTYGTLNGVKAEDELFLDLNTTVYYDTHSFYVLGFGAYERSNLRRINERYVGGFGMGIRVIGGPRRKDSKVKISITNALLYEKTDFDNKEDIIAVRNSTRFKIEAHMFKNAVKFTNSTFVQPSLLDNNLRWNALTSFSFHITKHLALVTSLINSYESFVVENAKNTDVTWTFGLSFGNN
jgi:putative salt-induced outer membrane protein YdiY